AREPHVEDYPGESDEQQRRFSSPATLSSPREFVRAGEREGDGERRAAPLAVAVRADCAAVHLREVAHDCEAESEAAVRARRRRVGLAEALEDVRQEAGADALPGVAHANLRVGAGALQANLDAPARGRELDGVGKKVP